MAEGALDDLQNTVEFAKKHTATASNQIIAPAAANATVVIDFMAVGGDVPGALQLKDSDGTDIDGYFFPYGSNSGVIIEDAFMKKCTKSKGLNYTQTGGGNWTLIVKYHYEYGNL